MFTLNTKLSEYVEGGLKKNNACQASIDYAENLIKKNPNITFKEAFKLGLKENWAYQTLIDYDGVFDGEIRKEFFKCIVSPMVAFQLHLLLTELDSDDEKILSSKFKGLLPTAEKELETGKVKRNKK
jgi:hypothetical protein